VRFSSAGTTAHDLTSEYNSNTATLTQLCARCGEAFDSDTEEQLCGMCVAWAELHTEKAARANRLRERRR
jgi:hypothetical protein